MTHDRARARRQVEGGFSELELPVCLSSGVLPIVQNRLRRGLVTSSWALTF